MSTKPPSDYTAETTAYYDTHAAEFCENTVSVDMSELYTPFLREMPPGCRILDAGCGSGRDSVAFLKKGYKVVSFDASPEMVTAATKLTGQTARVLTFDALDYDSEFEGIWACASLLHVAGRDLESALARLSKALKPNGVLYLSFKYGDGERMDGGRFFNDLTEELLKVEIAQHPQLELVQVWTTEDLRKDRRGGQPWLQRDCSAGIGFRQKVNVSLDGILDGVLGQTLMERRMSCLPRRHQQMGWIRPRPPLY